LDVGQFHLHFLHARNDPLAQKVDEMLLWLYATGCYKYYYDQIVYKNRDVQRREIREAETIKDTGPLSAQVFIPSLILSLAGLSASLIAFTVEFAARFETKAKKKWADHCN